MNKFPSPGDWLGKTVGGKGRASLSKSLPEYKLGTE